MASDRDAQFPSRVRRRDTRFTVEGRLIAPVISGASGSDRITGSPPGTCEQASTECDRRECWLDE